MTCHVIMYEFATCDSHSQNKTARWTINTRHRFTQFSSSSILSFNMHTGDSKVTMYPASEDPVASALPWRFFFLFLVDAFVLLGFVDMWLITLHTYVQVECVGIWYYILWAAFQHTFYSRAAPILSIIYSHVTHTHRYTEPLTVPCHAMMLRCI